MRTSTNPLIAYLKDNGIRPSSFAHFLSEYVKRKPDPKSTTLSRLLTADLKNQAKLIQHYL